jgi:hypothetical protein
MSLGVRSPTTQLGSSWMLLEYEPDGASPPGEIGVLVVLADARPAVRVAEISGHEDGRAAEPGRRLRRAALRRNRQHEESRPRAAAKTQAR